MNYGDIRTTFKSRLNRRDCTDALADGFISDALKRIQRVLRTPLSETYEQITISAANYLTAGAMDIPFDYLGIKNIVHSNSAGLHTTLKRQPLEIVQRAVDYGAQGCCTIYARRNDTLIFGPLPLAGDVIRIDYYQEFADVTGDSQTQALYDVADDLIIYGALSYAATHWSDKRKQAFEELFLQIVSDIQEQADRDELAGDACVSQAFSYPSDDSNYYYYSIP